MMRSLILNLTTFKKNQLTENVQKARRDLRESVWRAYKHLLLLAKDNTLKTVDLGLVHSSAADTPVSNILNRLSADGDVEKGVSPNFLVRNWPPAFKEWATKSVRDAFYASPVFPRLLNPEAIKETITRGVENGLLAYVGKTASGKYHPLAFRETVSPFDIEFSEDMFIVRAEDVPAPAPEIPPAEPGKLEPVTPTPPESSPDAPQPKPLPVKLTGLQWTGDVPPQKWMNFYTKVLSRFAATSGLKIEIRVDINPPEGAI